MIDEQEYPTREEVTPKEKAKILLFMSAGHI